MIKNPLHIAKNSSDAVPREADLSAEFPQTSSSSDKVSWSICEILDDVIKPTLTVRTSPLVSCLWLAWQRGLHYSQSQSALRGEICLIE